MKKFSLAALTALCSIAANTNVACSESNQLYIESSVGFKNYAISNYKMARDADYATRGRWMDYNYGTDLNLRIGYYLKEDIRISVGYKKSKQMMLNFFNGVSNLSNLNVVQQIDAYVFNVYKDFPITNTSWTPYVGAGVGIANVSTDASAGLWTGARDSVSGSVYRQLTAGLSYSLNNFDLFSELSYGGVGESTWRTSGDNLNLEKTMNLAGSFGVRYRF